MKSVSELYGQTARITLFITYRQSRNFMDKLHVLRSSLLTDSVSELYGQTARITLFITYNLSLGTLWTNCTYYALHYLQPQSRNFMDKLHVLRSSLLTSVSELYGQTARITLFITYKLSLGTLWTATSTVRMQEKPTQIFKRSRQITDGLIFEDGVMIMTDDHDDD
jgi:hypothetical protein